MPSLKGNKNIPTPVSVANGGTGVATLGDAGVLIGNGTGAVQVTGAGTSGQVLTSNGAGVDPTFQAATGITQGTVLFPQTLNIGSSTSIFHQVTSAYDGSSAIYTVSKPTGASATITVARFLKDTSGTFYKTHVVSLSVTSQSTETPGIAVVGSFVYIPYTNNSNVWVVYRLAAADLTGEQLMTISGVNVTNSSQSRGAFADSTFLYFNDNASASGRRRKYSISGTTLTHDSAVDYDTTTSSRPAWSDGTSVFFDIDPNIGKDTIAPSAFTSVARNLSELGPLSAATAANGGFVYGNATMVYRAMIGTIESNTAVTAQAIHLIPVAET